MSKHTQITRSKIKSLVQQQLEESTDALTVDEAEEIAAGVASTMVEQFWDVVDDEPVIGEDESQVDDETEE